MVVVAALMVIVVAATVMVMVMIVASVVVVVGAAAVIGSGKVIRVFTVRAARAFANLYGNDHESPVASTHHSNTNK